MILTKIWNKQTWKHEPTYIFTDNTQNVCLDLHQFMYDRWSRKQDKKWKTAYDINKAVKKILWNTICKKRKNQENLTKNKFLRSDLKENTVFQPDILRQADPARRVSQSGHSSRQAGRKETRTRGRVSKFVQFSGHPFSSWRAGAVIHLAEVTTMPGGQKQHQEAHLHTCLPTRTLTHTHTWSVE